MKVLAAYGCKCELFQGNGLQQILVTFADVPKPAASTLKDSINNLNSLQKQTHTDTEKTNQIQAAIKLNSIAYFYTLTKVRNRFRVGKKWLRVAVL